MLAAQIHLTNLWLNGRLAAAVGSDLSCGSLSANPVSIYGSHMQRDTATVITGATQIGRTVAGLNSLLQLITATVVAVSLFVGMLLIDRQLP